MAVKEKFNNSKTAQKERGEVFTPTTLVDEMLDKLPKEVFTENKTFLDNSCGNGQFLFNVLKRKMANGFTHVQSLKTIYGCELDKKNALECKKRLLLASKRPSKTAVEILNNNIICADALDENHKGWKKVGFYWSKQV